MVGNRSPNRTAPQNIDAALKRRQALELRKAGHTYHVIAERMGYRDESGARFAVKTALRHLTSEPAADVRDLEIARLDHLLRAVWPLAIGHKREDGTVVPPDLAALDRCLKIAARRAAYLGLDAPVKFSIEKVVADVAEELGMTSDETAATIADLTAMLGKARVT